MAPTCAPLPSSCHKNTDIDLSFTMTSYIVAATPWYLARHCMLAQIFQIPHVFIYHHVDTGLFSGKFISRQEDIL